MCNNYKMCIWLSLYVYIYTYIHRVRFTWDQTVFVRPERPTFFTWNFTAKHCEGKKNRHSKNTVNVTFTEFFNVKVRFFVTFTTFLLWRFELFIFYLHNIFAVKVLPCFWFFLPRYFFIVWIFEFYLPSRWFVVKFMR